MNTRSSSPKNPQEPQGRANRVILRRTLILMFVCGILTFVVLAIKLFNIQIINHDKYEQQAIEQQVRETTVTANRGTGHTPMLVQHTDVH